jgi:hypothetical protein
MTRCQFKKRGKMEVEIVTRDDLQNSVNAKRLVDTGAHLRGQRLYFESSGGREWDLAALDALLKIVDVYTGNLRLGQCP